MKLDELWSDAFILSYFLKLLILINILAYKRQCHNVNYKTITDTE